MGRSGTSKAAAQNTFADLRAAGAGVEVVQGDVVSYDDVERTVLAAKRHDFSSRSYKRSEILIITKEICLSKPVKYLDQYEQSKDIVGIFFE